MEESQDVSDEEKRLIMDIIDEAMRPSDSNTPSSCFIATKLDTLITAAFLRGRRSCGANLLCKNGSTQPPYENDSVLDAYNWED